MNLHLGVRGAALAVMARAGIGWRLWLGLFAGACGAADSRASAPPRIVTSFYPVYVAALNVAGGVPGVAVANLTEPITGCLHDFQLTTRHMRRLADADILVVNGGGMESFLGKVSAERSGLKVVDASAGIGLLPVDEGGEKGDGAANAHVWVSPELAIRQVRNIAEGLASADMERAAAYRANGEAYAAKLGALRERMHRELGAFRGRRIVTFHEAFPYFAREFGLVVAAVVQRDPGTEPSPRELAETIETVRRTGVGAVFAEPQYPATGAEAIRRETGVRFGLLDPVSTGPEAPELAREAYLRAMEKNIGVIREALR